MTSKERIPFLDLVGLHSGLRDELADVFRTAVETANFVGGPQVEAFEKAFARYCRTEHCVGVSSGTDALRFSLIAVGVGRGDAVITAPNSFIATTEAISQTGAKPIFVDIDESTYNLDAGKLQQYISNHCRYDSEQRVLLDKRSNLRVRSIVPVHLYGQMADMDPILEIGARYGLMVVEDACQAHGAEYFSHDENRWRRAGSIGSVAAFSFYPGKNLGACGEGGAVTTDNEDLAAKVRMLRDHGQKKKYHHEMEGYNGRLDAVQAGILEIKLRRLKEWNNNRIARAKLYDELFEGLDDRVITPSVPAWSRPVYHLYVIRTMERETLQARLTAAGIDTGIHYPIPLHLSAAYESLGYVRGDFPTSERVADEVLSLPMFPSLDATSQRRVAAEVQEFWRGQARAPFVGAALQT